MRAVQREKLFDHTALAQYLTKKPNGLFIRHLRMQSLSQEPLEAQAVQYLKLHLGIRQIVQTLENQDLEHQHVIERRAPAWSFWFILEASPQKRTKYLPIHHRVEFLKRIALVTQLLKTLLLIKETALLIHPLP